MKKKILTAIILVVVILLILAIWGSWTGMWYELGQHIYNWLH